MPSNSENKRIHEGRAPFVDSNCSHLTPFSRKHKQLTRELVVGGLKVNDHSHQPAQLCCARESEQRSEICSCFSKPKGEKKQLSFFFSSPTPLIADLTLLIWVRPRAGFYQLVAGLIYPAALLRKSKVFCLPVPTGQDF